MEAQRGSYEREIKYLQQGQPLPKSSSIVSLTPFLDDHGLLRLGGRLNKASEVLGLAETNPIILPKGHISTFLIRHFHEKVQHQGRHITEGALRSNCYWVVGAKRTVLSVIHKCVHCRKLRGQRQEQLMADLPLDRLTPGPPFSSVGVDTFGPWEVVTRKTRGGAALKSRCKWLSKHPNLKEGDVVLLRDAQCHRNNWPMGIVVNAIKSDDGLVRKAVIRTNADGKMVNYTRPVCELVLLLD